MKEVQKKDEAMVDHRCFCSRKPLMGMVGECVYEFKNSSPKFFLKFEGEGTLTVSCSKCYRKHTIILKKNKSPIHKT